MSRPEGTDVDRSKKRKPKTAKVAVTIVPVGTLIAIGAAFASTNLDFSHKRLDRGLLTLGTVQAGPMEIRINATGVLLPREVEWLSSEVDGQVAELVAQPGDRVEAGQVIVRMENVQLRASAEEAESLWRGSVAERTSFAAELENQVLDQEAVVLAAKFAHEREILQEEAEAQLIETSTIPEIQYRKTRLNVAQLAEIHEIERQRLQRQIDNKTTLLAVKDARIQQAKSALDRANSRVDALSISAGIAGVVQELPLEIGQRLRPGTKLGQIADQDALFAELRVAARQASAVAVGQPVSIDTRNGVVDGAVSRVDPAVSDGLVAIDVKLDGVLPKGARPELPVEGIIFVSQIERTLFVEKPTFARADSELAVYRMGADGQYAHRTNVVFGKVSVNYAQIVAGLSAGDRIVLSDSSTWQEHDTVMLSN